MKLPRISGTIWEIRTEARCNSSYCLYYSLIQDDDCGTCNWDDCMCCPANLIGDKQFFMEIFK